MRITKVGTRELKNRLSQYLRRVQAGETIIVTQHGKPVGQISPIQPDLANRLKKMEEAGVIEWNGQPIPSYVPKTLNRSGRLLSDLVAESRE